MPANLPPMPTPLAPIALYDSGVGGLSVWQAVRALLPQESLLYVADTAHVPYGEKSRHTLVARALTLGRFFRAQGAKAIVVPCNTATAAAIGPLREANPDIPVIGIEPAVKPAARLSRSGRIGVLATTGTLASPRFRQLVRRAAGHCEVLLQPCPGWVLAVERGELETPQTRQQLAAMVQPLLAQNADVLVLGCTHFPFLLPALHDLVGPEFPILETGHAVARQLARQLLERYGPNPPDPVSASWQFFSSGDPTRFSQVASALLKMPIGARALPLTYC